MRSSAGSAGARIIRSCDAGSVTRPLLVVDTPLLLYRAFFSIPKSVKNNALLGTANTVLSVAKTVDARAVVMCLGAESATYRTEAYPAYHAHRPPMPDELKQVIEEQKQ